MYGERARPAKGASTLRKSTADLQQAAAVHQSFAVWQPPARHKSIYIPGPVLSLSGRWKSEATEWTWRHSVMLYWQTGRWFMVRAKRARLEA